MKTIKKRATYGLENRDKKFTIELTLREIILLQNKIIKGTSEDLLNTDDSNASKLYHKLSVYSKNDLVRK